MSDNRTELTEATRQEDEKDSSVQAGADRPPTAEEEKAAESAELDSKTKASVAEHQKEMDAIGAEVKGEGQIS